jgi:NTP pyrophosphatase (non-canonical NTP hydrolase)
MSKVSSIVGKEYFKAKDKHPVFPDNSAEALCIIAEELGELAQAINDKESKDRQIEEAAHVAVTAIRFIEQAVK